MNESRDVTIGDNFVVLKDSQMQSAWTDIDYTEPPSPQPFGKRICYSREVKTKSENIQTREKWSDRSESQELLWNWSSW